MQYLFKILFREVAGPDVLKIEKEESELLFLRPFNKKKFLSETGWKRILAEKERLRPELARRAVERYNSDSNYRFLYDRISDFLVESLKTEIWFLDWGEFWKISGRAAAWCPFRDSLLENSTLLCESIAKGVFPRESDPSYGVQLVSGFSKNLLNIFLDNGGVVNPEEVMEDALAGEVYKKVSVFD
ncbi:hypothetical protein AAC387_Pa01g0699 [Persea americana]